MASIVTSFSGMTPKAKRTIAPRHDGQDVTVQMGNHTIFLSREEASQLAVELLDAIDSQKATP